MKKLAIGVSAALTVALLAGRSWAPIFSFFPGLSKLVDRSEFIVVAQILNQSKAPEYDMGGGATQAVRVLAVLKGDIKPGLETTAYLRNLPFRTGRVSRYTVLEKRFAPGERYVLFLVKNRDSKYKFAYRNENSSGDSFWISPSSDLSKMEPHNERGNITYLLNDVVKHEKERLKDLEETIAGYLEEDKR